MMDLDSKAAAAKGLKGPLDVDEFPGAELLSAKEKDLCATLRLLPKHYLYIKDRLIKVRAARTGGVCGVCASACSALRGSAGGALPPPNRRPTADPATAVTPYLRRSRCSAGS
jgi:hypothetical protein